MFSYILIFFFFAVVLTLMKIIVFGPDRNSKLAKRAQANRENPQTRFILSTMIIFGLIALIIGLYAGLTSGGIEITGLLAAGAVGCFAGFLAGIIIVIVAPINWDSRK